MALSVYDVQTTLSNIDLFKVRVLIFGGLALIFNFVYFGAAIREGFKHKVYSIPVAGTLLFIPHDLLYLLMYPKWFGEYHHWFPRLFWFGLIITNVMEMVFLYQTLKWGRKELLPKVSQSVYVLIMLAALAGTFIVWLGVKKVLADELWLFTFGWTVWFCVPFVIPLMLRRQSTAGQSRLMWLSYIGMAIAFWIAVWPLDPFFRSAEWLGLGGVIVCWALATLFVMKILPAAQTRSAIDA